MIPALHAEWVKATSLWSTWLCLAGFAVAAAGISAAVVGTVGDLQAAEPGYDAGLLAFYGLNFGHVAVIVVAVLLTAGEYGRQTVHDALVAVPRRGVFVASKVAVGGALVLATATVTALSAWWSPRPCSGRRGSPCPSSPGRPWRQRCTRRCWPWSAWAWR
ncbi:hypothetical protein [Modestobacter sp. VKM Ac-2978]|uniref:hypothetical protein n=1 Tax=Modestobacter sp. VKM Ac-2978 TaxID=3004132 RepID=UPI0022AAB191|nr:hypothetical protein [Modestobacter sp. VKM Ac-2978]MCZ2850250.1 hypothetical protein [Modestobacter sp. VKM Ac-2978]